MDTQEETKPEVKEETKPKGPKRYKADRKKVDIVIELDEVSKNYQLVEMDGTKREIYLDYLVQSSDPVTGQIKNFKDSWALLISLCLQDDTGKFVDKATIQKFSTTMQADLFKDCQELNSVDKEGPNREKKESSSGETTSTG